MTTLTKPTDAVEETVLEEAAPVETGESIAVVSKQDLPWWQKAVIYQIYPKSFQDSNGDGVGDLQGIIQRLDYLKDLGIDAIWLSPVCRSPQDDNGYDISDYQDIDPLFGNLADMDELIAEAGKRDIKILIDLVLNHCSDEHSWFKEALKGKDNPYHDYFIWRDGEEGKAPNEMRGTFGGSAWEWVPELQQYYFHQFSVKQPDLNWENPKVRQEIYKMINWWMDRGAGGFRLDVIDQIAKEPDNFITNNGPRLHEFIQEMSKNTFQRKGRDLVTVGETWGATPELAELYSDPSGKEFSMVFQFEHVGLDQQPGKDKEKWDLAPLDFLKLKEILSKWQTDLHNKGWNSLFWNNHDLPRIVSRWGNDQEYWKESAKMLGMVLHGMQGTPYVFQGEELGMTNWDFDVDELRDIESINMYKERKEKGYPEEEILMSLHVKSRDNARTPMQWDTSENAGFSEGEPWIHVNPNYTEINAQSQVKDPDSIYSWYKQLIDLRKKEDILSQGDFRLLLPEDEDIFAYERTLGDEKMYVIANFHGNTIPFPAWEDLLAKGVKPEDLEVVMHNYAPEASKAGELQPYEAILYKTKAVSNRKNRYPF